MHVEKPVYLGVRLSPRWNKTKYMWMRDTMVNPCSPFLVNRYKLN